MIVGSFCDDEILEVNKLFNILSVHCGFVFNMGDAEVFGKLSRIFETHGFANDDAALDDILEDFDPSLVYASESQRSSPQKNSA